MKEENHKFTLPDNYMVLSAVCVILSCLGPWLSG